MAGETTTQKQLLVFPIKLQNLKNPGPTLLERRPGLGIARRRGGQDPEGVEGSLEAGKQTALALEKGVVGRSLIFPEEAVLVERELMKFVADFMVLGEGGEGGHGVVAAGVGAAGVGSDAGSGGGVKKLPTCWPSCSRQSR